MAGGRGERFWPLSKASAPKPFLRLLEGPPLLERTVRRLKKIAPPERIIIATNKDHVQLTKTTLPNFPPANIIAEPYMRDTAPCIILVAAIISARAKQDNPVMIILPADHMIENKSKFTEVLLEGSRIALDHGKVVTVGIKPSFPSTGFGYIKCGQKINCGNGIFKKGLSFVEKPDQKKAKKLFLNKEYLWNSGIFIWSMNTFLNALAKHKTEFLRAFEIFRDAAKKKNFNKILAEEFPRLEKISIDYALMEKLDDFIVTEASFDWDDLGTWDSLAKYMRQDLMKNSCKGLNLSLNSKNNVIANYDKKHLVALLDVEAMTVVNTADATLICPNSSGQNIKNLLKKISENTELNSFL